MFFQNNIEVFYYMLHNIYCLIQIKKCYKFSTFLMSNYEHVYLYVVFVEDEPVEQLPPD